MFLKLSIIFIIDSFTHSVTEYSCSTLSIFIPVIQIEGEYANIVLLTIFPIECHNPDGKGPISNSHTFPSILCIIFGLVKSF